MNEDFDRNLDTQRRQLDAMDTAIANALGDEPAPAELPVTNGHQTYAELTQSNDRLRQTNGWTTVDLDAALSADQVALLDEWRSRQRTPWSTTDLAMVGLAGALGTASIWFDAAIDRAVRQRLAALTRTGLLQRFEKAGKRLPIDYMGEGFGGRAHRIKSAGHDLARPFEALKQIMDGEFRGVQWSHGVRTKVSYKGRFDAASTFEEALLRWLMHLGGDVLTPMSLPIPGSSLLYELDNETLKTLAEHAYSGLRTGEGFNLRSATIAPGVTTLTTEVVIRTHTHLSALHTSGSVTLTHQQQRHQTELRLESPRRVRRLPDVRTQPAAGLCR